MNPWVLLYLYNVKCRIQRTSRPSEWKDANLKFSCVLESPRGPLRFDLAVTFHDGGMRFMNLMRLQSYEVNFASRPRVILRLSRSTSIFQVKTLKYRQAEKVRSILSNVETVIKKGPRTSDHEEMPSDASLYFSKPLLGSLRSSEQQDFFRPTYRKQIAFLSHLSEIEEVSETERPLDGNQSHKANVEKNPMALRLFDFSGESNLKETTMIKLPHLERRSLADLADIDKTPDAAWAGDDGQASETDKENWNETSKLDKESTMVNFLRRRRRSFASLADLERDESTEILPTVPKLSLTKLPSWASDVGGISLPKSTDCQSKLRSVTQPYSPVKLDGLLGQRYHEEAAPTITVFIESGPVMGTEAEVDELSSHVSNQPDLVESSNITAVIDYD